MRRRFSRLIVKISLNINSHRTTKLPQHTIILLEWKKQSYYLSKTCQEIWAHWNWNSSKLYLYRTSISSTGNFSLSLDSWQVERKGPLRPFQSQTHKSKHTNLSKSLPVASSKKNELKTREQKSIPYLWTKWRPAKWLKSIKEATSSSRLPSPIRALPSSTPFNVCYAA